MNEVLIVVTLNTQFVAIRDDFLKIKFIQKTINVIYVLLYGKPWMGRERDEMKEGRERDEMQGGEGWGGMGLVHYFSVTYMYLHAIASHAA